MSNVSTSNVRTSNVRTYRIHTETTAEILLVGKSGEYAFYLNGRIRGHILRTRHGYEVVWKGTRFHDPVETYEYFSNAKYDVVRTLEEMHLEESAISSIRTALAG